MEVGLPVLLVGIDLPVLRDAQLLPVLAAFAGLLGGVLQQLLRREAERRRRQAQREAGRASRQVAARVGADPDLTTLITGHPEQGGADPAEVTRRVEEAMRTLAGMTERLEANEAAADQLRARVRSVEDKFPEASEFQKYADANQLFLAYQLGELTGRLERVERGQLGRLQVIGIVITTLVTAVAVAGGIVLLLRAAQILH